MGRPAPTGTAPGGQRRPSRSGTWSIIAWLLLVGLLAWSLWFFWAVWLPARAGGGCDAGRAACHEGSAPGWVTALRWVSWVLALVATLATFRNATRYAEGNASPATIRRSVALTILALAVLAVAVLALG